MCGKTKKTAPGGAGAARNGKLLSSSFAIMPSIREWALREKFLRASDFFLTLKREHYKGTGSPKVHAATWDQFYQRLRKK